MIAGAEEMGMLPGDGECAVPPAEPMAAPLPPYPPARSVLADQGADANRLTVAARALRNIEREISNVIRLLENANGGHSAANGAGNFSQAAPAARFAREEAIPPVGAAVDGRVVEGVFDGQNMVGSDGKIYTVPANYASKSKLVEGDLLKLTITSRGSFIYKQIGPIERARVMAVLGYDPTTGEYYATDESRRWSILKASVTYYHGDVGDEVVLLVPKSAPSRWASVENIIKKNPMDGNTAVMPAEPPPIQEDGPRPEYPPFGGEMPQ